MGSATKGRMVIYVCVRMREEEKECASVREKERKKERELERLKEDVSWGGYFDYRHRKKKKKLSGSLALSLCSVLQSFTLSLPPRTQWINQIPTQLFHFPLFSTLALQLSSSAPGETCTWHSSSLDIDQPPKHAPFYVKRTVQRHC